MESPSQWPRHPLPPQGIFISAAWASSGSFFVLWAISKKFSITQKFPRGNPRGNRSGQRPVIYAANSPKPVLAQGPGDCRDNERNLQSVFRWFYFCSNYLL